MKKIIVICVFSLVANFALFAQKQVVQSLHFSAPIKAQVWEGNKNDFYYKDCIGTEKNNDVLFAGVDFNWNRMTVNESGFSFLVGLGHFNSTVRFFNSSHERGLFF